MSLITTLQRNPFINTTIKRLRFNRLFDLWLKRFPLPRRTPSGLTYRIDSIPSWVVASEIFKTDVYAEAIRSVRPQSFADLGGNVGYLPVLIADLLGNRAVQGLIVEPNPELHARIEFHLRQNQLKNVHLVPGVVGIETGSTAAFADFYLNPSHIASGVSPSFNPAVSVGGTVRKIQVPVVQLANEWTRYFPQARLDLLKIDIEGAEIPFLKSNGPILAKVDAILIEWHKWVTSLDEVTALLKAQGFSLVNVSQEDRHAGTAFFRRL